MRDIKDSEVGKYQLGAQPILSIRWETHPRITGSQTHGNGIAKISGAMHWT